MINVQKMYSCITPYYPFHFGYSIFSKYFWLELFSFRNYINFFKYKYQLLSRGYADCDTFDIDMTMCYLNISMLREFRKYSYRCKIHPDFAKDVDQIIEGFEANYKFITITNFEDEFTNRAVKPLPSGMGI